MAPKGKKTKKKLSPGGHKKSSGEILSAPPPQAADFPEQLQDWRIRNINWGSEGVSKSWKLPSYRCNGTNNITPRLQLISCNNSNQFPNIPFLPSVSTYIIRVITWWYDQNIFN